MSEGVPRIQVANELLQSDLGRQSLLTFAYDMVLGRDPTEPEIVLYLSQMKHENVQLRAIVVTVARFQRVLREGDNHDGIVTSENPAPSLRPLPNLSGSPKVVNCP